MKKCIYCNNKITQVYGIKYFCSNKCEIEYASSSVDKKILTLYLSKNRYKPYTAKMKVTCLTK